MSVRASFRLSCQSRALGVGANEDGPRSGLSSGAAAAEDSYRLAALSHESRNLTKSSRVSLSVASCARAAHSAAFCRQYPIFCHMTVPPLEPAALSNSPDRSLESELAECSITLSREEGLKFQRVGWAKRNVPTRQPACGKDARGHGARRAFAHPTLLLRMANRGWKPKASLRVLSSRGNERRVRVRYEG